MINNFDFTILSETWKKSNIQIEGFKTVVTNTMKTGKHGRNSGGLALIYKSKFDDSISIQKSSPNFLWFEIKDQFSKTEKRPLCMWHIHSTTKLLLFSHRSIRRTRK